MLKKIVISMLLSLLFVSCSSDYDKRLKVSATTWIGYIPLFYAKEKGWFDGLNIKLLNVSSLAENMYLYKAGNSDAFVGTQYEYGVLREEVPSLKPIIMFDKSNGGDLVMSNLSVEELQNTKVEIDAYLEIDSINTYILEDFISKYALKEKKINYINRDQTKIELLEATSKPTIVVTYIPYNIKLEEHGFQEVASTKNNFDLLVCDAMFTKSEIYSKHEKQFLELKNIINRAINSLKKDPKEFYETIKPYMLNMSYDEFQDSLSDIVWINENMSNDLKERLNESGFPVRDLL